jgi:hypothetical protein
MRRIADPMVGGVVTSFVGELLEYLAIYFICRSIGWERGPPFPEPHAPGNEWSIQGMGGRSEE